jgi:hypothetical protein
LAPALSRTAHSPHEKLGTGSILNAANVNLLTSRRRDLGYSSEPRPRRCRMVHGGYIFDQTTRFGSCRRVMNSLPMVSSSRSPLPVLVCLRSLSSSACYNWLTVPHLDAPQRKACTAGFHCGLKQVGLPHPCAAKSRHRASGGGFDLNSGSVITDLDPAQTPTVRCHDSPPNQITSSIDESAAAVAVRAAAPVGVG